jgi:large subunit ribosomal protein L28
MKLLKASFFKKTMLKKIIFLTLVLLVGGGYSNRTRATKFNPTGKNRKYPNLQKKKVYIPELKKSITIRVSTKGMRTINKNGAFTTLKKAGILK